MKKKLFKVLALGLIVAMVFTGCGLGNDASTGDNTDGADNSQKPTVGLGSNLYEIPDYTNSDAQVVRISVTLTAGDYGVSAPGVFYKTFVDKLEELSGGTMVGQVYPGGQLASTTDEVVNGLKTGAFEISEVGCANFGDYTSAFTACNVPFLYKDVDEAYQIMSGEFGQKMFDKLYADTGIRALGFMTFGMRQITTASKVISNPEDLKGLKMRVQSDPTQLALFEELGASTATVAFSELFTALQQKLVDGEDNTISIIVSKKFYEVQDTITMSNHLPNFSMYLISDDFYNSLTAEQQGWMNEAAAEATKASYEACIANEGTLIQQLKDYGLTVTELSDEQYEAFATAVPKTLALCEDMMGTEEWNQLQEAIADLRG